MAIARGLAAEANEAEKLDVSYLAREITSRGGIAPHARGREKEEYKGLPLFMKNKKGLKMDEMASEMGLDESTLSRMIRDAYPPKTKGRKARRTKYTADDFEDQAFSILEEEFYESRP